MLWEIDGEIEGLKEPAFGSEKESQYASCPRFLKAIVSTLVKEDWALT
jgi:hypothetical protein